MARLIKRYDAAIFDLDGTLVDSLQGLVAAVNHAVRELKGMEVAAERLRTFAGRGTDHLFKEVLGTEDNELIVRARKLKVEFERAHRPRNTKLFEGIDSMLKTLKSSGLKLAVLSNKEEDIVRSVVNDFAAFEGLFDVIAGARHDKPLKPDPTVAKELLERMDVPAQRCLYIGDTDVDMMTGRAAGLCTVGVTWGFRTEAELRANSADVIVKHPHEITKLISEPPGNGAG